jgi:lysophospholipase L1-like esterase
MPARSPFVALVFASLFVLGLRAQDAAPVAPTDELPREESVAFRFDLADAAAGGDGHRPFLSAPSRIVPSIAPGVFLSLPALPFVNAVFAPSAAGETTITSGGLRYDFSEEVGGGRTGQPPARGPFGSIEDPSGTLGLPDYRKGEASLLEMPANAGISFDLATIRAAHGSGAKLETFRAVAGSPSSLTTGWLVLVDGKLAAGGQLEGRAWKNVEVKLPVEARVLTLVTTDAGSKRAFGPPAFFGDAQLEGRGTPAQGAPAPLEPWPNSDDFRPWMPVRLGPGLGIAQYELFLWPSDEDEPESPSAVATRPLVWPDAPLAYGQNYSMRLRCRMEDGKVHRGRVHRFRTATAESAGAPPPFDVSPSAQRDRTAVYEVDGLAGLVAALELRAKPLKIAFWGDSITDVSRWQRPLVERLRREEGTRELELKFLNRGVNGAKLGDLLAGRRRWPRGGGLGETLPAAQQMVADRADVVVLFIGANEVNYYQAGNYAGKKIAKDSPPTTDAEFREQLTEFVAAAHTAGSSVVLGTPALRGEKPDGSNPHDRRLDRYADICAERAEHTGAIFVPVRDACRAWLMNRNWRLGASGEVLVGPDRGLLTTDGTHPNAVGCALFSDLFATGIMRALRTSK